MGSIFTASGSAPALADLLLLVLVVRPCDVDVGIPGEDELGPARRELAASPRGSRLQQHGAALRAPRHGEGAPHVEPFAVVVELVHLGGVGEERRLAIEDQRVVLPGVPQSGRRLEELVGAVVAGVVRDGLLEPVVLRLAVVDRRHDIPGGAPTREMVQRGEGTRDVEGRVIGRRVGRSQPDPARHRGADPEHDAQVQFHRARPGAHGLGHRAAVDPRHGQPVVEEHEVEAAVFERAGELLVVAGGQEPVLGGRVPPRAGVDRGVAGLHEPHQRHLPPRAVGHRLPPTCGQTR